MESLLDLSARLVSGLYPFQLIEEAKCCGSKIIPEPVQRKIIFYSFPRDENYILMYSNHDNNDFKFNNFLIENVIQIGFHLTGKVTNVKSSSGLHNVSINFDRCKITLISCTCQTEEDEDSSNLIFWCDHVVALAIHRIRFANQVTLRVPISETLLQLDRGQLQKMVQYLISQHTEVLPTAQNLADDLLTSQSKINQIHGAPDPTAGPSINDEHSWALSENHIQTQVKLFINNSFSNESVILSLFSKIHQMLLHSDSNGPRILILLTREFQSTSEKHRELWDNLTNLWKIVVMNPKLSIKVRKSRYEKTIESFKEKELTPTLLELISTDFSDIFKVKKSFSNQNVFLDCLRVQALKSHGFINEAVALSLKILKNVKKTDTQIELEHSLIVFQTLEKNEHKLELGLLSLSQPRQLPTTLYLQEKHLKLEDKLLSLLEICQEKKLIEYYAGKFLEKSYNNSLPVFNFSKFIYKTLQNSTAFKLSIKYLKQPIPQSYIQTTLEHQQTNLALLLINSSKTSKTNLDILLKTIGANIKSISSIFKIAQESFDEANSNLLNFSFQLGLHVCKSTLKYNHRRRWDIVRWIMNTTLSCGFYQIIFLLQKWAEFFTPNEAVGTVANNFLSRGTSLRLNLNFHQQQQISEATRSLALMAMRHDPGNCALNGLTICESDSVSFETSYQIILEAAKQFNQGTSNTTNNYQLNCQQIFTIARYMEHRGYPLRAYKLAAIAIGHLHIPFNQETHTSIGDIHWTCNLAQSLGDSELSNLLPVIISNIKCASVLSEILKRAAMEAPPRKCPKIGSAPTKIYNRLKLLVEATISSYISTIHNRLTHISPRHYADFIEYLSKAKECFLYAPDGQTQFRALVNSIKLQYKGKKKLLLLLIERFG